MATGTTESYTALLERKRDCLGAILEATQSALLLVNLDGLDPLLARKDALIEEMRAIDEALAQRGEPPPEADAVLREMASLLEAVLENERTLEERLRREQARVRQELREVEQQNQVRRYLERGRPKGGTVNLKR